MWNISSKFQARLCKSNRNKTDVERRQTFGRLSSVDPNLISPFAKQSSVICVVCTRSNEDYLRRQGSRNCQNRASSICCLFVDIHGSVAFPIVPIATENTAGLSKATLSIISNFWPLKLLHSRISYPIWEQPVLWVCLEERAIINLATIRCISEQLWLTSTKHCYDAFVQTEFLLIGIAMYLSSG